MPSSSTIQGQVLDDLRRHLQATGYSAQSIDQQCATGRKFLEYIEQRGILIAAVRLEHVVMHLRRQRW